MCRARPRTTRWRMSCSSSSAMRTLNNLSTGRRRAPRRSIPPTNLCTTPQTLLHPMLRARRLTLTRTDIVIGMVRATRTGSRLCPRLVATPTKPATPTISSRTPWKLQRCTPTTPGSRLLITTSGVSLRRRWHSMGQTRWRLPPTRPPPVPNSRTSPWTARKRPRCIGARTCGRGRRRRVRRHRTAGFTWTLSPSRPPALHRQSLVNCSDLTTP
mmetsp:Transcript_37647/g.95341  ORF Transcript_37647/g.95341 Transcript_37647/m.95341 type:complete len:214 (-) Transcript_37647:999-1640(-)